MRQPPGGTLVRILSLVAFLAAGAGDLVLRHGCPHHEALPHASAEPASHGPGGAKAGAEPDHRHRSDGQDHGPCTCVGDCHAGAATPAAHAGAVQAVVAPSTRAPAEAPGPDGPLVGPTPYRLHHPNAPPART